ncbi:hypothetical protein E2C01_011281 [Portunus trituberculatus]|uniref:Uncharacterized protein n=1 Tax=Portunus trituberculatus TaxID=210409 RepID=A0A5B7DB02_PORTR|nr:hypothetical protein [Portunus trituberculatus]
MCSAGANVVHVCSVSPRQLYNVYCMFTVVYERLHELVGSEGEAAIGRCTMATFEHLEGSARSTQAVPPPLLQCLVRLIIQQRNYAHNRVLQYGRSM